MEMEKKKKNKASFHRKVDLLACSVSLTVLAWSFFSHSSPKETTQTQPVKPLTEKTVPPSSNLVDTIGFYNDTVDYPGTFMYTQKYIKHDTKEAYFNIVRCFVPNNERYNLQITLTNHERNHAISGQSDIDTLVNSPKSYVQLRVSEEVAANVAAILTADLEYRLAKDTVTTILQEEQRYCLSKNRADILKEHSNDYMSFYFNAIKEGKIDPDSKDPKEIEKRYEFLVNGAYKMWNRLYWSRYGELFYRRLRYYIKNQGIKEADIDSYHKKLTHQFTFGGVDLSPYIKADVFRNDVKIDLLNDMIGTSALVFNPYTRAQAIDDVFAYGDSLVNFEPHQQKLALSHLFVASKLKSELRKYDIDAHPEMVSILYNKTMHELSCDRAFLNFVDQAAETLSKYHNFPYANTHMVNVDLKDVSLPQDKCDDIRQYYSYNGRDLTEMIKGFDFNSKPTADVSHFAKYFYPPIEIDYLPQYAVYFPFEMLSNDKERLSKELYILIPNLKNEHVMNLDTEEVRKTLTEMFNAFYNIPDAYKGCNVEEQKEYSEKLGYDPHYFENRKDPFNTKQQVKPSGQIPPVKDGPDR